jgi:DNA-binding MarR family transcriptional regulator
MMVKHETPLDLGHAALFLGLRVKELVLDRLAAADFADIRESHGYVIQHLIEGERSITELAGRMEVTQQAASKMVAELARVGLIEAVAASDRRSKIIRLSQRGWRSVRAACKIRRQIERSLIRAIGPKNYEKSKTTLLECLAELGAIRRIQSRRVRAPT